MSEWSLESAERFTERWLSGDVNSAVFMEGAETLLPWLLAEVVSLRAEIEADRSYVERAVDGVIARSRERESLSAEVVSLRSQLADAIEEAEKLSASNAWRETRALRRQLEQARTALTDVQRRLEIDYPIGPDARLGMLNTIRAAALSEEPTP